MTQQHQIPQPAPRPDLPSSGQPAMKPKRKPTWFWILLGVVIAVVVAYAAGNLPASGPSTHTVTYQAEGAGTTSGMFTFEAPTGTQQAVAALPLRTAAGGAVTFDGLKSGAFVYLSVQNQNAAGSVTCRIQVDGAVISENTSTGGYVIATCQGRVP